MLQINKHSDGKTHLQTQYFIHSSTLLLIFLLLKKQTEISTLAYCLPSQTYIYLFKMIVN